MSRKDPRRRMMVPLSAEERAALRGLSRTSLGDALRRVVQAELARGLATGDPLLSATGSGLPLQLPRKILQQVTTLADQRNQTATQIIRLALTQHLTAASGR